MLKHDWIIANQDGSESRIEKDIIIESKLDMVRFVASNIKHCYYDLQAVIYHHYLQLPSGKKSDQFSAFVQFSGLEDTQPEVWKEFSTQGKPIINQEKRQECMTKIFLT